MSPYEENQILYRAYVSGDSVHFEEWRVVRLTPKGAWIAPNRHEDEAAGHELHQLAEAKPYLNQRWVSTSPRVVSLTKEDAVQSLRARNSRYVWHCERRLKEALRREAVLAQDPVPERKLLMLRRWPRG